MPARTDSDFGPVRAGKLEIENYPMEDSIKNYSKQFEYEPQIEGGPVPAFKNVIVGGMGGSHLSADLYKFLKPSANIQIHRSYGLPARIEPETLAVAFSYSGNTEETISFAKAVIAGGLPLVVIATGGKLIDVAKEQSVPYIQIPKIVSQPRVALVVGLKALACALGDDEMLSQINATGKDFDSLALETEAGKIADEVYGKIPVVWSSDNASTISYNWKIRINETAKTPAFANVFPELNHNEMSGFGVFPKGLSAEAFYFLAIVDEYDSQNIEIRMSKALEVFAETGLQGRLLRFAGNTPLLRALNSIVTADWVALKLAEKYGVDPDTVPLVEKFKKLI